MHKAPNVFPIVGGRKVEHLKANLVALDISLSKEQIEYLDSAVPFDPGFPTTMIVSFFLLPCLLSDKSVGRRNGLFFLPFVDREDGEAIGLATYQALTERYFGFRTLNDRYTRCTIYGSNHIHPVSTRFLFFGRFTNHHGFHRS